LEKTKEKKTMDVRKAYKLCKLRKDGSLGPLFIGRRNRLPIGQWLTAENIPTKGYARRPGWHTTVRPEAPHLAQRDDRVWVEVEIKDYYKFDRPRYQGSYWLIAKHMKIVKML